MTERYFLTPQARSDLAEIADTIAQVSGPARAAKVVERIRKTMRFLAENPGVGHPREDLTENSSVKFWAVFSYLIVFVPGEGPLDSLGVVRIIHGARDPNEIHRRLR